MTNTLGLDDDLDTVELVQNVEEAFGIEITNVEGEHIYTVGELYDLLLSKIPANETDRKCASATTFYRLRRGLRKLGFHTILNPSTDLHFLETGRVRAKFKELEREAGVRLPPVT